MYSWSPPSIGDSCQLAARDPRTLSPCRGRARALPGPTWGPAARGSSLLGSWLHDLPTSSRPPTDSWRIHRL